MGLVASEGRIRTDAISSLESSAFSKVQTACNFVNAEVVRLRQQTVTIWVMCAVGALLLMLFTGLGLVVPVVAAGVFALAFVRARTELTSGYKAIAARRIVAGLGNGLAYNPKSSLTRQQFVAMDLFADRCDRLRSRDEIAGKTRSAKYSLHQVLATGKSSKSAIFDGVIIKIDFSESLPGHTVIIPDRDGQLLAGSNGGGTRRKKDLVMLKSPAFERLFDVYSTDYFEARKVVTPKFMEVVMDAQARLDTELRLCIMQKSLFIAIAGHTHRFETRLFAPPLTPQAAVGKLVHLVSLAERLAELRS